MIYTISEIAKQRKIACQHSLLTGLRRKEITGTVLLIGLIMIDYSKHNKFRDMINQLFERSVLGSNRQ
jgi:hypothetical protein